MRKLVVFLLLAAVYVISQSFFDLNVTSPGGVVKQPYILRTVVFPKFGEEGVYVIGLEGHLEIFGINLSVGTYGRYPGFVFDEEVYAGFGMVFGGLFFAFSTTADSFEELGDSFESKIPRVSFGIAGCWKEGILFSNWGRFELSYEPKNLIIKLEDGRLAVNEEFDWTDASATLKIISQGSGMFLVRFTLVDIKEFLYDNGLRYIAELAIPSEYSYIYGSVDQDGKWKAGLGLSFGNFNILGLYDSSGKHFNWLVAAQF